MDRHRFDPTHAQTPLVYSCPACHLLARMLIAWPFWECPHCHERLIPADLYPIENLPPTPDATPPAETTKPPAPRAETRPD